MLVILLAAAVVGVDYGWQPRAGGGFEYIIQIEPETLESLRNGEDVVSDLPPFLRDVRSYRITVGSGDVPRLGTPPLATRPEDEPPAPSQAERVEPTAPSTFEIVDDLTAGPPSEFTPGPVVDRGQWQPRQVDDRFPALPEGTASPDAEERPSESGQGTYVPPIPLHFPTVPSLESPEYEAPEVPFDTGTDVEWPEEDSELASEPPQLPYVANSSEIPAEQTSYEANVADNRTAAKVPIRGEASEDAATASPSHEEKGMWWPLAVCLLGLCLSLGGNVYLGWLTVAFRSRYRHIARRLRAISGGSPSEADRDRHLRWG